MRKIVAAAFVAGLLMGAPVSHAAWPVFDASNYAQNVLQAARALEQIGNQVRSLQNEAQMLLNQARNLASLDYSSLGAITGAVSRITGLMNQAEGVLYDIGNVEQQFQRFYPSTYDRNTPDAQLVADARTRWERSVASFRHALQVQSEIVSSIEGDRQAMEALVDRSQGATGLLQATQAGNQLIALQIRQMAALQAMLASQGRAQALEQARQAESQEQAREQRDRFIGTEAPYVPERVRMFHE